MGESFTMSYGTEKSFQPGPDTTAAHLAALSSFILSAYSFVENYNIESRTSFPTAIRYKNNKFVQLTLDNKGRK